MEALSQESCGATFIDADEVTFVEMLAAPCVAPFEITFETLSDESCGVTFTAVGDVTLEVLDEHGETMFPVTCEVLPEGLFSAVGETTFEGVLDVSCEASA